MAGPKTPQFKGKKVTPMGKGGGMRGPKLNHMEIAEGNLASEQLASRPTKDFSRSELGALMQVPPGGAEPHQIKKTSRQFNRVSSDLPVASASGHVVPQRDLSAKKPMSSKTPKIDLND
jgi:hypothetical protein